MGLFGQIAFGYSTPVGKIGSNETWVSLGSAEISVPSAGAAGAGGWGMHNFTVTPSSDCLQQAGSGKALGQGLISISLGSTAESTAGAAPTVLVDKIMVEP